jgi:hypothetical protein
MALNDDQRSVKLGLHITLECAIAKATITFAPNG